MRIKKYKFDTKSFRLFLVAAMDAIKKKMQAMKVEKDNAMDRSDACEQAAKDAKVRAAKAEEEVSISADIKR